MGDVISCPFPNFNGTTIEIWEYKTNLIPAFYWASDYYMLGLKLIHVK